MEPEIIEIQLVDPKYPNLKKQLRVGENIKNLQEVWSKENISDGFRKFYDENGRYPVADEIDRYEYLPSSRQIQRSFGGLVKLRKELGLEIDNYGIGSSRSKIATIIGTRGGQAEREMEKWLVDYFGEHFVHVEKPLYKYFDPTIDIQKRYKQRADFFIYAQGREFCIDVFFARDIRTLKRVVNIKELKYTGLLIDVYLVNLNDRSDIKDIDLRNFALHKNRKFEENVNF